MFRSVATLEKTVEKCHIELDEAKDSLTFTLHCKHGNRASAVFGLDMFCTNCRAVTSSHFILQCVVLDADVFSAGLMKTHNLSYQDSESLQAVFDKDSCANVFRAQPRSGKSFIFILFFLL